MNSKIAVFKSDNNDFEKYYNDRMMERGCSIFPLSRYLIQRNTSGKRIINISDLYSIELREYDVIVVFEQPKLVPFIKLKMNPKAKLILWNWNKQNAQKAIKEKIIAPFCDIWTFDSNDAERYGWKLNNQFYLPLAMTEKRNRNTPQIAFCVCLDKKRYPMVKVMRKKLMSHNIECNFAIVKDGTSEYNDEDAAWLKSESMPYGEFLRHTLESDIVVDLVQQGQNGLTVRTLESLFYGKKLITNNTHVQNYPFYCPSNVLIWSDNCDDDIDLFVRSDYQEVDDGIKGQYTFESWLERFMAE